MDTRALVLDSAGRMFADHVDKALLDGAERGQFAAALWSLVAENGLPELATPAGGGTLADAFHLLRVAGRHALPLPLAEVLIANHLTGAANCGETTAHLSLGIADSHSVEGGEVNVELGQHPATTHHHVDTIDDSVDAATGDHLEPIGRQEAKLLFSGTRNDGSANTLSFVTSPDTVLAIALSGKLEDGNLGDIVQLFSFLQKTGELTIRHQGEEGVMVLDNEKALFETVRRRLGSSRLFAVGIGSAPNGYLLERIARFGRGTYTFIASPGEVAERITGLFEKLERPSLSDIELHWNDAIEMWPDRVPDLYAGEPLIVTARVPRFVGDVLVSGRIGERPWEARLALRPDAHGSGIGKLWARAKIAALMDSVSDGADRAAVREAVTAVALQHHLVSKFTSLVAVDVSPSRPVSEPLARGRVPLPTPRGWKSERTVEGALPRAATPARLLLWIGLGSLAGAWAQARRA